MPLSTEKTDISVDISDRPKSTLLRSVKNSQNRNQPETPQAYVNRIMREKGLSHVAVQERARKLKHKLSYGYMHDLARGHAENPSIKLIKAIAAGLGRPEDEVFAIFRGKQITQDSAYGESLFAVIWNEYRSLSPADQKELRPMIDMLQREIQRRLKT